MLIYMQNWPRCSVWVKLPEKNRTLDNGTYHEWYVMRNLRHNPSSSSKHTQVRPSLARASTLFPAGEFSAPIESKISMVGVIVSPLSYSDPTMSPKIAPASAFLLFVFFSDENPASQKMGTDQFSSQHDVSIANFVASPFRGPWRGK